ncbi:10953_t:CDS:2 [Dentiscutata erythropus]|uniref:10953_t:CDS:1 n=1 Tax=Dentiscutata erythropus TaxID=1348616 RepID=A0A9N8VLL6_9GLOM|nr:10953_t:CDS:2 [Dentiscutata erythropus]
MSYNNPCDIIIGEFGTIFGPTIMAILYNPPFNLNQLMGIRQNHGHIPRPANAFFLLKNALMLAAHQVNIRRSMTDICKIASLIWLQGDKRLKATYSALSDEAKELHRELFPGK